MERGRWIVIGCIACVLTLSIGVTLIYVSARGPERLPMQLIRLGITALVCLFLYRGVPAARVFAVLSAGLGGLFALFSGTLFMAVPYLTVAAVLAFAPSVSEFQRYQRRYR